MLLVRLVFKLGEVAHTCILSIQEVELKTAQ